MVMRQKLQDEEGEDDEDAELRSMQKLWRELRARYKKFYEPRRSKYAHYEVKEAPREYLPFAVARRPEVRLRPRMSQSLNLLSSS
jgi:hypothetical protein